MTFLNHTSYKDCSPYKKLFQPVALIYYDVCDPKLSHRRHNF